MVTKPAKKKFNYNYLSVFFLYIWAGAFLLSAITIKDASSRMFPSFISIAAIILATILLIKTYRAKGKSTESMDFSGSREALIFALILLAYIGLATVVGFYFATPVYLFVSMYLLGQRNYKLMAIVTLSIPLGVYLFFDLLLGMQIPMGMLGM
ncbi:MAG TPA: hypothetical protein DIT32_04635 [Peptococcaceae bacterium]|nr:hypothetical protein [Peptococcaceae bacterium]